ncbi:MAG: YjjG family noncanonical pyrimidine nucleotidase [Clostridiales bacterium]|nr:YjjG family noncanonical pyrimidine nucleotidase [Clostridiales bacterium]
MPRYRFFLLDADNTIFDFDAAERRAWFRAMRLCGIDAGEEMYASYHEINASLWKDLEKGLVSKDALVVERHRRTLERYRIEADASKINSTYMPLLSECAAVLPGALDFLKRLRAVADERKRAYGSGGIYIITNGVEKTQKKRLSDSEVKNYVDGMFISEAVGYPKPDIRYFESAFAAISGFDKKAAVVVGDSLTSDIKGGNGAGVDTVWFDLYRTGLPDDPPAAPLYTAADFDEIYGIITA